MSFLNRFFEDAFDQSKTSPPKNSFESASKSDLASHLEIDTYDSFQLTDAVRPAMDLKIKPTRDIDTTFTSTKNPNPEFPL